MHGSPHADLLPDQRPHEFLPVRCWLLDASTARKWYLLTAPVLPIQAKYPDKQGHSHCSLFGTKCEEPVSP